jgi:hypothetical protein
VPHHGAVSDGRPHPRGTTRGGLAGVGSALLVNLGALGLTVAGLWASNELPMGRSSYELASGALLWLPPSVVALTAGVAVVLMAIDRHRRLFGLGLLGGAAVVLTGYVVLVAWLAAGIGS